MKCAALSAPSALDRAGQHHGLVGHDRDRVAAEAGEAGEHGGAEVGLHLEGRALVEDDVDDVAHVVDLPAVAGHDVEDLGDEAVAVVAALQRGPGSPRPTTGSSSGRPRTQVEGGFVAGAVVVDQAAAPSPPPGRRGPPW